MTTPDSATTVSKPEWHEVHNIKVEDVVITIKQSTHRRPRYSFDIQFFGSRGDMPGRWCNYRWTGEGEQLEVSDNSPHILAAVKEARQWVKTRMVQDYWDQRAEYESKQAEWAKARPKGVGTHQKPTPKKE